MTFIEEIDRTKRKMGKNALNIHQKNTQFFSVGIFRINERFHKSSISVQTELSLLFELATSSSLHRKRRLEYSGKSYPFMKRGLPRPQVVDKERYGIHPFGMSRQGGVFEIIIEYKI